MGTDYLEKESVDNQFKAHLGYGVVHLAKEFHAKYGATYMLVSAIISALRVWGRGGQWHPSPYGGKRLACVCLWRESGSFGACIRKEWCIYGKEVGAGEVGAIAQFINATRRWQSGHPKLMITNSPRNDM